MFEDTLMLGLKFEGRENFWYCVRGIRPDVTKKQIEDLLPGLYEIYKIPKYIEWEVVPYDEKKWRKRK